MKKEIVENTLVDYPRLELLKEYVKQTADIPGLIAEVGVYKGGTAYLICEANELNANKPVLLFDTFEGMPPTSFVDHHKEGDFADTSIEKVQNLLGIFNSPIIIKGTFPNMQAVAFNHSKFSLVHLDCDIYRSVSDALEFFYPRMSPGGIIVLDDYNEPDCKGAKIAADDFFKSKPFIIEPTVQSQAIIRF